MTKAPIMVRYNCKFFDHFLSVSFYKSPSGQAPVRKWLKSLSKKETKIIGLDIMTVQYGWPLGMPLVRKVEINLWEIRSNFDGKISRVLFMLHDKHIVLLHAFIKKSRKIPKNDLVIAQKRMKMLKEGCGG